jgi:hypothetical protein
MTWRDALSEDGEVINFSGNDITNPFNWGPESEYYAQADYGYSQPTAQNGTISQFNAANRTFRYTPNPGFEGLEVLEYTFLDSSIGAWNGEYYEGIKRGRE